MKKEPKEPTKKELLAKSANLLAANQNSGLCLEFKAILAGKVPRLKETIKENRLGGNTLRELLFDINVRVLKQAILRVEALSSIMAGAVTQKQLDELTNEQTMNLARHYWDQTDDYPALAVHEHINDSFNDFHKLFKGPLSELHNEALDQTNKKGGNDD